MPYIEPVAKCEKFHSLDRNAQWFYLNLLTVLDSAGKHDASPLKLRAAMFPLKKDIRDADISRWLAACQKAGLITVCGSDLQRQTCAVLR